MTSHAILKAAAYLNLPGGQGLETTCAFSGLALEAA